MNITGEEKACAQKINFSLFDFDAPGADDEHEGPPQGSYAKSRAYKDSSPVSRKQNNYLDEPPVQNQNQSQVPNPSAYGNA